jgi:hypothetical protein
MIPRSGQLFSHVSSRLPLVAAECPPVDLPLIWSSLALMI